MSGYFYPAPEGFLFRFGRGDPVRAREAVCGNYRRDDEEETEDDSVSCYNCRYRRWTQASFTCMREREDLK